LERLGLLCFSSLVGGGTSADDSRRCFIIAVVFWLSVIKFSLPGVANLQFWQHSGTLK
jgi:hypothetical protein